jgi:hypothetical protein
MSSSRKRGRSPRFNFQTATTTVIASASEAIHRAAKQVRVDCFVAFAPRNDANAVSRSRGVISPELCMFLRLSKQRAQGMPGARRARSLACNEKSIECSHHGHIGFTRHSPRDGVNKLPRALPGDRLVCHRRQRSCPRQLDTSAGVSGPHALAVRFRAVRQRRIHVHRIPLRVS